MKTFSITIIQNPFAYSLLSSPLYVPFGAPDRENARNLFATFSAGSWGRLCLYLGAALYGPSSYRPLNAATVYLAFTTAWLPPRGTSKGTRSPNFKFCILVFPRRPQNSDPCTPLSVCSVSQNFEKPLGAPNVSRLFKKYRLNQIPSRFKKPLTDGSPYVFLTLKIGPCSPYRLSIVSRHV